MLVWLLPPSPLAINAGLQVSLQIADAHTHTTTAIWRILTSLPIQSRGSWARRPSPRLSNHSTPQSHSADVIGLGGRVGARRRCPDNWLINVQPVSHGAQGSNRATLLSHLSIKRLCVNVCVCGQSFSGLYCTVARFLIVLNSVRILWYVSLLPDLPEKSTH